MSEIDHAGHGSGYSYSDANLGCAHTYLLPSILKILGSLDVPPDRRRLFDLGCGNGSVAARLAELGWDVAGADPSDEGIAHANAAYPSLRLEQGSCYDPLAERFGRFPVVLSLEVVEHTTRASSRPASTAFWKSMARPSYQLPTMVTQRTLHLP